MANDFAILLTLAIWGVLLLGFAGSVVQTVARVVRRVVHAYRSRKVRNRFVRSSSRFRRIYRALDDGGGEAALIVALPPLAWIIWAVLSM